jgi:hypothetical protein
MDEGNGLTQAGQAGSTALRLCNLVAQSSSDAERRFKVEMERDLTRQETEPWEIVYFKLYKSQSPVG